MSSIRYVKSKDLTNERQGHTMARSDIEAALASLPGHVGRHLTSTGRESLDFLAANLPDQEQVKWLASAAPKSYNTTEFHCLLAVTDRRLLFVAPAPQVLSWSLPTVTKVQSLSGSANHVETFFIDDSGGGEYQLGADAEWGPVFAAHAKRAVAEAILRNT
jgi:hypothetical protein